MACEQLNKSSALGLIGDTDTFLFDCDGVLWNPDGIIEGSVDAVMRLKQMGKKVLYITNNCSRTRAEYARKLVDLGFPATEVDVMCPSSMAAMYLDSIKFKGKVYLIGNPSIAAELDAVHIQHFGTGPDDIHGELKDWVEMEIDPDVRCVLVGFDRDFSYMKIIRAARYLQRSDCIFLATNQDPTYPPVKHPPISIPGTGALVTAVVFPTKRKPILLGKPAPFMFEQLKKLHNVDPARCVMIGDTLMADMGLAKACGLKSLLVLSGVTAEAQLTRLHDNSHGGSQPCGSSTDASILPDFYTNCIGDLITLLM